MRVGSSQPFDLSPRAAIRLQTRWAGRVVARGAPRNPLRSVVGVDCSIRPDGVLVAAAVRCLAPGWEPVEMRLASGRPGMPYVPGLLSFREAPLVLEALRGIAEEPDVVLVDGQGLAHPRRLGLACHLGLHLDVPVVGCAKSRLVGAHEAPGGERGARTPLRDGRERIGTVLRTRSGVKPVYVSVGHRIALRSAERVVLETCTRYRLPEPVRHADRLSRREARKAT